MKIDPENQTNRQNQRVGAAAGHQKLKRQQQRRHRRCNIGQSERSTAVVFLDVFPTAAASRRPGSRQTAVIYCLLGRVGRAGL